MRERGVALVRLDCEGSLVAVSGAELAWVVGASRDGLMSLPMIERKTQPKTFASRRLSPWEKTKTGSNVMNSEIDSCYPILSYADDTSRDYGNRVFSCMLHELPLLIPWGIIQCNPAKTSADGNPGSENACQNAS